MRSIGCVHVHAHYRGCELCTCIHVCPLHLSVMHLCITHFPRLEDPFGFPFAEKQKSERRQVLLHSIVEQLKKKESTVVIATLAAGKSRLLKKWRTTDTQLVLTV